MDGWGPQRTLQRLPPAEPGGGPDGGGPFPTPRARTDSGVWQRRAYAARWICAATGAVASFHLPSLTPPRWRLSWRALNNVIETFMLMVYRCCDFEWRLRCPLWKTSEHHNMGCQVVYIVNFFPSDSMPTLAFRESNDPPHQVCLHTINSYVLF